MEPTTIPSTAKTVGGSGINVIIEIPAGTNHKVEYDYASKTFKVDQENGKDRVIDFLPYPGNYGFISGTLMDVAKGGDGDALDVLVIAESLPTGTVIEVIPIAALELLDNGEIDTKLIAIPVDSTLRVIQATNFEDFMIEYNIAQTIIKDWFLNYKGLGKVEMIAWRDEKFAMAEIEKWKIEELGIRN
ncbi:MAG: inorganic pyrophosphatase [Saprospiraceae bacterium]